jgi:DNA-binding transcriptional regulator YiaG
MANRKVASLRDASVLDTVEQALAEIDQVRPIAQTLRTFNKLKYGEPATYGPAEIVALRNRRLGVSQAVFAGMCNIKLSTLQKWERGVNHPTPPMFRLFQLIEHGALSLIEK